MARDLNFYEVQLISYFLQEVHHRDAGVPNPAKKQEILSLAATADSSVDLQSWWANLATHQVTELLVYSKSTLLQKYIGLPILIFDLRFYEDFEKYLLGSGAFSIRSGMVVAKLCKLLQSPNNLFPLYQNVRVSATVDKEANELIKKVSSVNDIVEIHRLVGAVVGVVAKTFGSKLLGSVLHMFKSTSLQ